MPGTPTFWPTERTAEPSVPTHNPTLASSALPTLRLPYMPGTPTLPPTPQPPQPTTPGSTSLPTLAKPTRAPTPSPTPSPTNEPTPTPMPTVTLTPAPSSLPTLAPSALPTLSPTRSLCGPGFHVNGNDSQRLLACLPCKAGSYSQGTERAQCDLCELGTYGSVVGLSACAGCEAGKFGPASGLTACSDAPRGSFVSSVGSTVPALCPAGTFSQAGVSTCMLCPASYFSEERGAAICTRCPLGMLTPTTGSTTVNDCLAPNNNFAFGTLALLLSALVGGLYVIFGRFRFVSYIRRERIVMEQVAKYRVLMTDLTEFRERIASELWLSKVEDLVESVYAGTRTTRKVAFFKDVGASLAFAAISLLVLPFLVMLGFVLIMGQIFFQSLIISKRSGDLFNFKPYRASIVAVATKVVSLMIRLSFPTYLVDSFRRCLKLLLRIFEALSFFKIDLARLNVTCEGSKAPFILILDLMVLGSVIILIESQFQVFRGLVFRTTMNQYSSILISHEYRKFSGHRWDIRYTLKLLLIPVIQSVSYLLNFTTLIQYMMAQIKLAVFVSDTETGVGYTDACNLVPGLENYDKGLAAGTAVVCFSLLVPVIYELAKVVVPNDAEAVVNASMLAAAQQSQKVEQKKALALQDEESQRRESEKGREPAGSEPVETSGETEAEAKEYSRTTDIVPPAPGNKDGETAGLKFNAWSYFRMPLTYFAPDLLLAHVTDALVFVLKSSVYLVKTTDADGGDEGGGGGDVKLSLFQNPMLRRRSSAVTRAAKRKPSSTGTGDAKLFEDLAGRASMAQEPWLAWMSRHLKLYFDYASTTLTPHDPESEEGRRWKEMERKIDLPTYFDLLRFEAHILFKTVRPQRPAEPASLYLSYLAAAFLCVFPIGHVLTRLGRYSIYKVLLRFKIFFAATLGFWDSHAVNAYDIFSQVHSINVDLDTAEAEGAEEDRNRVNTRYSQAIEATIAPRAILLQIVPALTIWSVFSIATCSSAVFASDPKLHGKSASRPLSQSAKGIGNNTSTKSTPESAATHFAELPKLYPFFIWDAFERARREEGGRYAHREWITWLVAIQIFCLKSRAFQFVLKTYTTFLSVLLLCYPASNILLGSMLFILLPVAAVQCLEFVIVLGKMMNIKDLKDYGTYGATEREILQLKSAQKSQQEVIQLMTSFKAEGGRRGSQVFVSNAPAASEEASEFPDDAERSSAPSSLSLGSVFSFSLKGQKSAGDVELSTTEKRDADSEATSPVSFFGFSRKQEKKVTIERLSLQPSIESFYEKGDSGGPTSQVPQAPQSGKSAGPVNDMYSPTVSPLARKDRWTTRHPPEQPPVMHRLPPSAPSTEPKASSQSVCRASIIPFASAPPPPNSPPPGHLPQGTSEAPICDEDAAQQQDCGVDISDVSDAIPSDIPAAPRLETPALQRPSILSTSLSMSLLHAHGRLSVMPDMPDTFNSMAQRRPQPPPRVPPSMLEEVEELEETEEET